MKARLAVLAAVGVLSACPRIGPDCSAGKTACGDACVDLQADARHCGGCGAVCAVNQVCVAGGCQCREGTTGCFNDGCVDLQTDARNCNGCGNACALGFACAGGACVISCASFGLTQCGTSCVDLTGDPQHCGSCTNACAAPLTCHSGACTYDVIAACFSTDQVVGLSAADDVRGPLVDAPTTPESLASMSQSLLVGAAFSEKLYQLDLTTLQAKLGADGGAVTNDIGPDARQVLVDGALAYVINAGNNTLQVLRRAGGALSTISQLNFGANANPQAAAKVGPDLFIPLYGSFSGPAGEAAGGYVVRVNVADPTSPVISSYIDLRRIDLHPYGAYSSPRPSWIAVHQGALYVPLNNLDGFAVGGPGMLAKIDPATEEVTGILLGDGCANAIFAAASAAGVLVGCAGDSDYSQFPIVHTIKTGVVLVSGEQAVASWAATCPPATPSCADPSIARVHAYGSKVYAGDQAAGRLFVLDSAGGGLTERRGYANGGAPIDLCPIGPFGYSNVADMVTP
jgi:hypothetical protein